MRTALVAILAATVGAGVAMVLAHSPSPLAYAAEAEKPERITGAHGNLLACVLKDSETGQEFLVCQIQTPRGVAVAVAPITARKQP